MTTQTISVIVPAYNLERYLDQCLDSIGAQTFVDFECIVVNDGSTDQTQAIVEKYTKKDVRFRAVHKKNGGVSTARNAGFAEANGEYTIFLDGDDFFSPNLLEILYENIEKTGADIAVCNFQSYFESMSKYSEAKIDFSPFNHQLIVSCQTDPDDILNTPTLMLWNKLIRTSLLRKEKIRCNEKLHRAEDIEFMGRVLVSAKNITIVDENLVFYRTDTDVSSANESYKYPYDVLYALENLKDYLVSKQLYMELKRSYAKIAIYHLLAHLYFTETYPVHKAIYTKTKKLLSSLDIEDVSTYVDDARIAKEATVLLEGGYESWLRFRIANLRDDREAKYISYLLSEYQRKYNEEKELRETMLYSLSWKATRPLRAIGSKLRRRGR